VGNFQLALTGRGLLIDAAAGEQLGLRQGVRSMGFMTTRVVDATGADLAVAAATNHTLAERRSGPLLKGVEIGSFGAPEVRAVSVRKVPWWRSASAPTKGFTSYSEHSS
jgi:hypothetical protein